MVTSSSGSSPKSPIRRMKGVEQLGVLGSFVLTAAVFLLLLLFLCFFYFNSSSSAERSSSAAESSSERAVGDYGTLGGWVLGTMMKKRESSNATPPPLSSESDCDLFDGEWVWDESYPLYSSKDCPFLDQGFRCSENGRPDRFYTNWRWQPSRCNLLRFDAKKMLEALRDRRLAFVGDSIGRNQWESLLCMLSSAVVNKSSIYEVNGSPITKHNGFLIFVFKDYNCTIEYYRSPFLVVQSRAPAGLPENIKATLKLDIVDWMSSRWRDADVLIFNTGHWWNYEKTIRGGCYFQEGNEVKMNMSMESAYQRSIKTLFDWIHSEVNTSRTQVIYRTYAPVHFRGGDWKTGGSCHLETLPELGSSQLSPKAWAHYLNPIRDMRLVRSGEVDVLNVTKMTARRRDGHLSLYYLGPAGPAPLHRQDCSHWCLPGVPDIWNELLYDIFFRSQWRRL